MRCYRALKWHTGKKLKRVVGSEEPVILSGPFRGMRYPDWQSVGSELEPKVIGTYESELHHVLERLCAKPFRTVIDIGAAEGYYAVGIAKKMQNVHCYAFETNPNGRVLCDRMAALNGVSERVTTLGHCDKKSLSDVLQGRALIICDCEGYEYELLDLHEITNLIFCDFLIEVHAHDISSLSEFETITEMFESTHFVRCINMREKKELPEAVSLGPLNRYEKEVLLDENRSKNVGWVFLEARKHS